MKKFSDYYINYTNILQHAIVGFEFEFYTEKPYYKLMEYLNMKLNPIKVHGFRNYHTDFKPDKDNFKLEPDTSGGNQMIELITGPIQYPDCKIILLKIMKLLQEIAVTDERCSIHINISFDKESNVSIDDLKPIKLILDVDEDMIYQMFPNRVNNYYAKSVKRLIPFKGYNQTGNIVDMVINNIELPNTKYFGINIKEYRQGWIEYRYVGGTDYQFKTKDVPYLMDYFILLTWNSIEKEIDEEDKEKILDYLNDNISNFKKFLKYDDFLAEYPSIKIEVDKSDEDIIIKSYYDKLYDKLYDLLMNTYNLNDCIINYDTETQKVEVVETLIKGIFDLKYLDFIECDIIDGTFYKCNILESTIKNSHIETCTLDNCEISNSKLTNCDVNSGCVLENIYFYGGFMDGELLSGVMRGGVIGPNAIIGEGVKLVTNDDNYFGNNEEETNNVEKKKGKNGKF
jgi:hypothetical protein